MHLNSEQDDNKRMRLSDGERLSDQEEVRRNKLTQIISCGYNPYPADEFLVTHFSHDITTTYSDAIQEQYKNVHVAGRIMSINDRGKVVFLKIQDSKGLLQLYVRRDDLCKDGDTKLWSGLVQNLDLGDIIGVKGFVFITKTGEISLHVESLQLLTKSLKPLPVVKRDAEGHVFDEVTNPEFKYRQRYADLVINPDSRNVFILRTRIIQFIRDFLNQRGALEVETPVLQSIPGGANARPFVTDYNALNTKFYLRIANELYLKRLIVGGFDWVYEFSRNFRNEGMDKTHNPEFTILESYTAYKDYYWMMNLIEQLIEQLVLTLHGKTDIELQGRVVSFKAPFKRVAILDAINKALLTGIQGGKFSADFSEPIELWDNSKLALFCTTVLHIAPVKINTLGRGKLIDTIFGELCEADFVTPTFIIDHPVDMSPLAKKHRLKKDLVERFELYVNGKELANAYSELNDPIDQYKRFGEQLQLSAKGDDEAMYLDSDFLRALEYGMPPTAGVGIGIDRLCMLLSNQASIKDVLLFPHLKPE
ncbi:MAG: lysine--tRNA ligase [Phycisphaerales bacterium]|nr:lysine--tRNA ligase [Phycisphaerales bacterium]